MRRRSGSMRRRRGRSCKFDGPVFARLGMSVFELPKGDAIWLKI